MTWTEEVFSDKQGCLNGWLSFSWSCITYPESRITFVASFSSIPYYSNSEIDPEKCIFNRHTCSITLDINLTALSY